MSYMLIGFADAKPSESIQPHRAPGMVVSALFVANPGGAPIAPPVLQYKGGKQKNKGARAKSLNDWLLEQHGDGLRIAGFCTVSTQEEAATMGLSLLEELPNTTVTPFRDGLQLRFPGHHVDFVQAVALQHYWFTLQVAALRAATLMPNGKKNLGINLDRFPAARANGIPGKPVPPQMEFASYALSMRNPRQRKVSTKRTTAWASHSISGHSIGGKLQVKGNGEEAALIQTFRYLTGSPLQPWHRSSLASTQRHSMTQQLATRLLMS